MANNNKIKAVENKKADALELLMAVDNSNFARAKKQIKMERLSKMIGQDFIVTIEEILPACAESILDVCMEIKADGSVKMNSRKLQNMTIIESVLYNGASLFKNERLMKKFGVRIPTDLLEKITTKNEREELYNLIEGLGGGEVLFSDVKN